MSTDHLIKYQSFSYVHTCFGDAEILLNATNAEFINAEIPEDLATSTTFDTYMDVLCAATGNGELNRV